jgi:hypothetical protein
MRMAQVNGEQSRCHRRSKGGHRFCAKNDEVAQSRSGSDRRLNASDCGKGISLFPFFLLFIFKSGRGKTRPAGLFTPLLCHGAASFDAADCI